VQPRERSLGVQPRERERVAHPGLKFPRREGRRRCRPVFVVDGKLARGPHTRSRGVARRGREEGFTSELLDGLDVAAVVQLPPRIRPEGGGKFPAVPLGSCRGIRANGRGRCHAEDTSVRCCAAPMMIRPAALSLSLSLCLWLEMYQRDVNPERCSC
jgi:hypothetical protein